MARDYSTVLNRVIEFVAMHSNDNPRNMFSSLAAELAAEFNKDKESVEEHLYTLWCASS